MSSTDTGFMDPKNRRDHIVPQVYLRGFIHPKRDPKRGPLEVFHLANNVWGEPKAPEELCAEIGFYDYTVDRAEETADSAFRELEEGLSEVRSKLRETRFQKWTTHREFLLAFAHMLLVRSRLCREGIIAARSRQQWFRVLEVRGTELKIEPFDPRKQPDAEALAKNLSITETRGAIKEGPKEWASFQWGLVLAPGIDCPFIATDAPGVLDGRDPDPMKAWDSGLVRLVFPFGWEFALVGSPTLAIPEEPRTLTLEEVAELNVIAASGAHEILIFPAQPLDMTWFGRVTRAVPVVPR